MIIGDKAKIKVLNKYFVQGEVIAIIGEFAKVEVPVYYGKHNQPTIIVEDKVENLIPVKKPKK